MISFTPHTQPQNPGDLFSPINDGLLQQGAQFKYQKAQQAANTISNQYSNIFGIQAYGKDAEVLSQLGTEAQKQISELAKQGMDNPEVNSRINSLISQYSNHPDVQAVAKRSSFYNNELKKKQEAEEKGLPYYSRSLESLNNYYNGDNYYTHPEGVNLSPGFIGVNLAKARQEALKDVPKERYLGKDGFYHERYNQDALDQGLNTFYTDPRVRKQMLYDIEDKHANTDWETEGLQKLATYKQDALTLQQQALQLGRNDLAQQYQNDIDMYDAMAQDPKGYGEQIKQTVYSQEFQDRISLDKAHSNFNSTEKLGEYQQAALDLQKEAVKFSYDKKLAEFKQKLETGEIPGVKGKLSDLDKAVYSAVVASGKPIYNEQGELIPAKDLASQAGVQYNPKESMDNKTPTSEKSPLPAKLKSVFETIYSGTALNDSEQQDLEAYVISNRDALGAAGKDDITNIKYETENGLKKIKWEKDEWGRNPKFEAIVVNSQEEYDKVPSGAIFIDSTGKPTKKQ